MTSEALLAAGGFDPYHLKPPNWRTTLLSKSAVPLFPGFYPPHPSQEENQVNETSIKQGYAGRSVVQTEAFSAHQLIYQKINDNSLLPQLTNLIQSVEWARKTSQPPINIYAPRIPGRSMLSSSKQESWLQEFADPEAPLPKTLPNAFRGEKLLDLVVRHNVPLLRALWYIKVVGSNEIASQKNRPGYDALQYTAEWTTNVCEYFKKQLADVWLPTMPTRFAVKGTTKDTLTNPASRAKYIEKMEYLTQLICHMLEEDLLLRSTFCPWLLHQFKTSNFGHLPFFLYLARQALPCLSLSLLLAQELLELCLARYNELKNTVVAFDALEEALKDFVTTAASLAPQAFLCPKLWLAEAGLLRHLLPDQLDDTLASIERKATSFTCSPAEETNDCIPELKICHFLDISLATLNMEALLADIHSLSVPLPTRIATSLTWATTKDRNGLARIYIVAALLQNTALQDSDFDLHGAVADWIAGTAATTEEIDWNSTAALVEQLQVLDLFSYKRYMQGAIFKGLISERAPTTDNIHRFLLSSLSHPTEPVSFVTQRRIYLGLDVQKVAEQSRLLSSARQAVLDCLSLPLAEYTWEHHQSILQAVNQFRTEEGKSRFAQQFVLPTFQKLLAEPDKQSRVQLLLAVLVALQHVKTLCICICEALDVVSDHVVLLAITDAFFCLRDCFIASYKQPLMSHFSSAYKRLHTECAPVQGLAAAISALVAPSHPLSSTTAVPKCADPTLFTNAEKDMKTFLASVKEDQLQMHASSIAAKIQSTPDLGLVTVHALFKACLEEPSESTLAQCLHLAFGLHNNLEGSLESYIKTWLQSCDGDALVPAWPLLASLFYRGIIGLGIVLEVYVTRLLEDSANFESAPLVAMTTWFQHQCCSSVPASVCSITQQYLHVEGALQSIGGSAVGLRCITSLVERLQPLASTSSTLAAFKNAVLRSRPIQNRVQAACATTPELLSSQVCSLFWDSPGTPPDAKSLRSPAFVWKIQPMRLFFRQLQAANNSEPLHAILEDCLLEGDLRFLKELTKGLEGSERQAFGVFLRSKLLAHLAVPAKSDTEWQDALSVLVSRSLEVVPVLQLGGGTSPLAQAAPDSSSLLQLLALCAAERSQSKLLNTTFDLCCLWLAFITTSRPIDGAHDILIQLGSMLQGLTADVSEKALVAFAYWASESAPEQRLAALRHLQDSDTLKALVAPYLSTLHHDKRPAVVLVEKDGQAFLQAVLNVSNWARLDYPTPDDTHDQLSSNINSGALNMAYFDMIKLESPANSLPQQRDSQVKLPGGQSNFDSETWTCREDLWSRDTRRRITESTDPPKPAVSPTTAKSSATGKSKSRKESMAAAAMKASGSKRKEPSGSDNVSVEVPALPAQKKQKK